MENRHTSILQHYHYNDIDYYVMPIALSPKIIIYSTETSIVWGLYHPLPLPQP